MRTAGIFLGILCSVSGAQPTPYCVSGADATAGGVLKKLAMPASSLGYIWDTLNTSNVANMVRPCRYWTYIGSAHRAHGYHEDTDSIHDPAAFGAWVSANPGKTWIIGNEPNLLAQDGLAVDQYARMFRTYHAFIRARDPSARFAVGGLAADLNAASFSACRSWWDAALTSYRTQFGEEMPIDVWNCHGYAQVGNLDPDAIVTSYFAPWRSYVDTVSGGLYAGKELWCTEFGVATWGATLAPAFMDEFMRQLCPRMESAGVNRFFWFIGPWPGGWDASFVDLALLGPTGQPTLIGSTYSALAQSSPNPVPSPAPSQLPLPSPPFLVASDFGADWAPLQVRGGDWVVGDGALRQTRMLNWGQVAQLAYAYRDVSVECDIRINAAPAPVNWAGITLRSGGIWTGDDFVSYLVLLRQNGELCVYTKGDGIVASVPGAVQDTAVFHRLKADVQQRRIEVSINGVSRIVWEDPHARRTSGMVTLYAGKVDAGYDNLLVKVLRPADFDRDGDVDQSDFGILQACFSGAFVPQPDPACRAARLDEDPDIDLRDFELFQGCYSGPDAESSGDCIPAP